MSSLLKGLLAEVKAGELNKVAAAPSEAPTPEAQNADVLESSQAMMAKINSFVEQVGQGQQTDPNADPNTQVDPNNPNANPDENLDGQGGVSAGNSVTMEVPAGMHVKLGSVTPTDSDSALRTIIGLMPTYFGE